MQAIPASAILHGRRDPHLLALTTMGLCHWSICALALSHSCGAAIGDRSCGGHRAETCAECPRGHGASWCNGDCQWDTGRGRCVDKTSDPDLYELLEVDDSADAAQIKKNYHKLSVAYHPDKNPDGIQKFQAIRDAYEVLSNPEKRVLYDTGGLQAVRDGEQGKLEEGDGIEHDLHLSLAEFYRGTRREVRISRRVICRLCRKRPDPVKCKGCIACPAKKVADWVMQGPMMFQTIREEDSMEDCKIEQTQLDVTVDRGASAGDRVLFKHMGPQTPGKLPGHVSITLRLRDTHAGTGGMSWHRRGNDLRVGLQISLREALLGFLRTIQHLDGHILEISSESVTTPGQVIRVEGEGMPLKDVPSQFGHLDIAVSIEFPLAFTLEERKELEGVAALQRHQPHAKGASLPAQPSDEL